MTGDSFMRLPEVRQRTGMGTTRIYELVKLKQFPEQIKLGKSAVWSALEVDAWIEEQKAKARPAGTTRWTPRQPQEEAAAEDASPSR